MLRAKAYINKLRRFTRGRQIWRRNAAAFERFVRSWLAANARTQDASARGAVVVQPWLMTAVPWYSIALGLFLAQRTGKAVTFICDDLPFGNQAREWQIVLDSIRKVLTLVGERFPVLWLSDFAHAAGEGLPPSPRSRRLAIFNAIWFLRGETKQEGREHYRALTEAQLRNAEAGIASLLAQRRFDYLVVAGGMYSSSGLWYEIGRERAIRVCTFDSGGPGTSMLSTDGIAAQLTDVPHALAKLPQEPTLREAILTEASAELHRRRAGVDKFGSQVAALGSTLPGDDRPVVIALNSSWDTSALGRNPVFENSTQWLVETVEWLLANTKETVVVRQHPAERLKIARTSDDYRKLLSSSVGAHPRLRFVAPSDPVNTYELLERAKVVLVHTSTVGIEAAAIKKTVLTASDSYYAALGFVLKAGSRKEYFDMLGQAIHGAHPVTNEQAETAMCCYYLAQCSNWVAGDFGPESFAAWGNLPPEELYRSGVVQDVLTAIDENIPIALLQLPQHRRPKAMAK
ncbi:MAG: hypothetical protein M3P27_11435 [Acidobacteriota bacterium]|nr:hypothetical protein [Acidobacteriota bacterium]